jgi:Flp pilus assembly protein TadG
MNSWIKRLRKSEKGSALIVVAGVLPLLVGAAGLATDTIQWSLWKRQLQRAADSGAIAGVYTRIKTDNQTAVEAAVNTDLALNNHTGIALANNFPDVDLLSDDGVKQRRVQVTLQMAKALPFSSMFMTAVPNIRATATAASVPGADEFCVLATDTSVGSTGIEITGSTYLDLGTCSLMADSSHPTLAASNGNNGGGNNGNNSTVKAKALAAVGGVKFSNSWQVTDYDPNSPSIADPFAGKTTPTAADCSKTVTLDMTKTSGGGSPYPMDRTTGTTHKDTAGEIVCFTGPANKKGWTVGGALKLQTGVTYVIDGGDLTMNQTGASITCAGCTIILTDFASNGTNTGNIKITGGTLSITAPTSDTSTVASKNYKGMALFQDRRATDSGAAGQNIIQGNNGASITGAVYIGNRSLTYTGGSSTVMACLQIVAKRVTFTGNSAMKLTSQCAGTGMTSIGGGRRVRLVA